MRLLRLVLLLLFAQEASAGSVYIVLFTPSDVAVPIGVRQRLTEIADVGEKFLFKEMTRCGYPPAVTSLFRREKDGMVEVLNVRGSLPESSGKYAKPDYAGDVIKQASEQYHIAGAGHVWWIFIYLGDRPMRFHDWRGWGNSKDGGWAMINYDTVPGAIQPELGLSEGFNRECFLKSTIHELCHGFGLPHVGPEVALGMGNSLMGPNPPTCAQSKYPDCEHVYLEASSAAMLWKHPLFSPAFRGPFQAPGAKLVDYKPVFNATEDSVTISGKVAAEQPVHSVVLIDDRGVRDEYWSQSYAGRVGPDGSFRIRINKPAKSNGGYQILFCFENGLVSGDGVHFSFDSRGVIRKSYSYRDGVLRFGD